MIWYLGSAAILKIFKRVGAEMAARTPPPQWRSRNSHMKSSIPFYDCLFNRCYQVEKGQRVHSKHTFSSICESDSHDLTFVGIRKSQLNKNSVPNLFGGRSRSRSSHSGSTYSRLGEYEWVFYLPLPAVTGNKSWAIQTPTNRPNAQVGTDHPIPAPPKLYEGGKQALQTRSCSHCRLIDGTKPQDPPPQPPQKK